MADPKPPPRPASPKHHDAGFPPLHDIEREPDGEGDEDDDLDADYHEDGGGD